ncbi:MAG TPA: hypothetical protein PKA90_16185, partial [Ignavibacteria bacterium]|nr:hypothetical protein [Ignavibacteria bacterium]
IDIDIDIARDDLPVNEFSGSGLFNYCNYYVKSTALHLVLVLETKEFSETFSSIRNYSPGF